jgi:hypothetical protein
LVRESFERANQVLDLTACELKTSGKNAADVSEKLFSYAADFQDVSMNAFRRVANTSISNRDYVKETTQQQLDGMAKRLDGAERQAAATMGAN